MPVAWWSVFALTAVGRNCAVSYVSGVTSGRIGPQGRDEDREATEHVPAPCVPVARPHGGLRVAGPVA